MPRPTPQLVAVGLGAITIAAALWWRCYGRAVSARAPAPAGPWAEISSGAPDEPRGARWLASHWAPDPQRRRSTVPLVFRASATPTGLRPLDLRDYIDVEPRDAFEPQVRLKRRLLNGPTAARFYASLAGERPQVLAAEAEVLAMLLDHLEQRFPQHYQVQRSAGGVATAVRELITGAAFAVEDYAACPLKLCGQLVQEDFVLLSPGRRAGAGAGAPPCLVAGCATYTFMEIGLRGEKSNMDLGKSVPHIHDPVPGFNDANGIGPKVARFFEQLEPQRPQFRSNWLFVAEEGLDPLRYDLAGGLREAADVYVDVNEVEPARLHLRVELQSVRRLPRSDHILFTLHCYSDPLPSLARAPKAAAVLRQAVLDLDAPRRKYRGMTEEGAQRAAAYLETLAGDAW